MLRDLGPDVRSFDAVDQSGDPAAMVGLLDVGCGFGVDTAEMARRMPPDGRATGIDRSETMITEARQRTAGLGLKIAFDVGDAMNLPYGDASFDACRAVTVLQHLTSPQLAIEQMARVTRPGGRVAAVEFDLGTAMIDHPDRATTRLILTSSEDEAVQGWMGRQLPRLFRHAGLTGVSLTAAVILSDLTIARMLFRRPADRLCEQGILTRGQARQWWSQLNQRAADGRLIIGATAFLVTGIKP